MWIEWIEMAESNDLNDTNNNDLIQTILKIIYDLS
jgi:hypothetical protein